MTSPHPLIEESSIRTAVHAPVWFVCCATCAQAGVWVGRIDRAKVHYFVVNPGHRTPISNLYCTGGYWHIGGEASAAQAYNCYKIIASDLKLEQQPWQLAGNEEPDSLIEQQRLLIERVRTAFPVELKK